jgi:ribosome maturation protein Sdo1
MKSESKRILIEIQKKAINPVTHKPTFRTPDEVLEEALDHLYRRLKQLKVL